MQITRRQFLAIACLFGRPRRMRQRGFVWRHDQPGTTARHDTRHPDDSGKRRAHGALAERRSLLGVHRIPGQPHRPTEPTDVGDLLINHINLAYHTTLMGAAGDTAVKRLNDLSAGPFILAVEGASPRPSTGRPASSGPTAGQRSRRSAPSRPWPAAPLPT